MTASVRNAQVIEVWNHPPTTFPYMGLVPELQQSPGKKWCVTSNPSHSFVKSIPFMAFTPYQNQHQPGWIISEICSEVVCSIYFHIYENPNWCWFIYENKLNKLQTSINWCGPLFSHFKNPIDVDVGGVTVYHSNREAFLRRLLGTRVDGTAWSLQMARVCHSQGFSKMRIPQWLDGYY
jgi:hypothetical protein